MRRIVSSLSTALLVVSATACTKSIRWEGSIEDALELSGGDGKPVMLYFTFIG